MGGEQTEAISRENEAGLQRKQRGCEARGRERWRETEPAAASVSVVGFGSPKLRQPEIYELSLYLSSKSSSLD